MKIKSIRKRPTERGPCREKGCPRLEIYPGRGACFSCRPPGSISVGRISG